MLGPPCDGLMTGTPGEITFAVNRDLVTEGVTLTDKEVGAAVAFAFRELKLVVEPSGAIRSWRRGMSPSSFAARART